MFHNGSVRLSKRASLNFERNLNSDLGELRHPERRSLRTQQQVPKRVERSLDTSLADASFAAENPYGGVNKSYQHMPSVRSQERSKERKHYPHLKSIDHQAQLSKLKELLNQEESHSTKVGSKAVVLQKLP